MFRCFCVCVYVCTAHSDFTAVFLASRIILKSTRTPKSTLTSFNHLRNAAFRVSTAHKYIHLFIYLCAHRRKLYIREVYINFNIIFWNNTTKIKIYVPWREKVDLWDLCVCVFKFQILKRLRIFQTVVWTSTQLDVSQNIYFPTVSNNNIHEFVKLELRQRYLI